ncbi:MAG: penicillin-binding protein 2 [bacterium]
MQDLAASRREKEEKIYPLAINKEFQQIYIVPKDIPNEHKEEMAEKLSNILDLEKETILYRMNKEDDPYEPLKNKVDKEIAEKIEGLSLLGVGLAPENWRYYPNGSLASHLIGFVGLADGGRKGQYGIEEYYNEDLQGEQGFLQGEKDIAGYWIPSTKRTFEPAEDGSKIVLTVDQNIQFVIEKELQYLTNLWQAESGTIIVIEPQTGAIRAMANWPTFNPNEYNKVDDVNTFSNLAIQQAYEPGSVFKPITMAAGLEEGKILPNTKYIDNGELRFGGSTIKNVDGKAYGEQTMIEVLEKSLNTGVVFVEQMLGHDLFSSFIQNFRFSEPLGIDISGEVGGNIANLFTGRDINMATISFGQGIAVTPLSLISAISAVANGGKLMRPFVVQKKVLADGEEIITEPQIIDQVMSEKTSDELSKMMVSVVDNGYGRPARVSGYSIAGKTGTAQVADLEKGGYSEKTIHTFVGFAPAFNPQFAILIKIDKPQGIRFASDSVSPSFGKLAKYLFNYLEIAPQ